MDTRYIIGIDLGTTNSVLSFLDSSVGEENERIELQPVPQLINPGEVTEASLLPSFLYVPGEVDFPQGSIALPWDRKAQVVIGELARKRGAENPVRLVASAKSWLSYAGVNRAAPILPWRSPDEVQKVSPVEASSRYLEYLRGAWDTQVAKKKPEIALAEQDIFLTIPASFDEEARELTLRAAEQAGFKHVTLLEEPQAAFYAWIESQGERWRKQVKVGDLILVCDVGGGTTDFSLISVLEENGELTLKRVAVGDHILLGGDNMDLALARLLQKRLEDEG
ncbi:MAG TPA: Hsp70 family protein, partial [Blastocatellia bacterium]